MRNKLLVAGTLALAMTCTTVFSSITPATVKAASVSTVQAQSAENSEEYTYCYAGLTWSEYWKAEGVMAAGDSTSSDELDKHGEKDKGAFDAVTRATANHGLHRGSYQCTAVIKTAEGEYKVSHWSSDGKTVYFTDGTSAGWSRGTLTFTDGTTQTMTEYDVLGLKYVPVKVKTSDYDSFKEKYSVVEDGGTLIGGYGEANLKAYEVTASVNANTNGLKTAEKQSDGSFTFTERQTGSDSGIKDQTLKTADLSNMGATVKSANGSYGEFLRVDFTKDYGDLGANMQAVKWTYYGNDSTRSTALATYGTKFAADNWMHKSMGIQLGLTDSIRCQLPKGYDGTGYWSLTIYALGYEDSTYNFEATDENIVKPAEEVGDTTQLKELVSSVEDLKKSNYTEKSWSNFETELNEAKELLAKEAPTQSEVDEAVEHLTAAKNALDKYVYGTANLPYADFYYGELNDVKEDAEINLDAEDKAASYRESGMYDAVSSATNTKSARFATEGAAYGEAGEGTSYSIDGVKAVNIAVPSSLYTKAKDAIANNKACSNQLLSIVGSMTESTETPSEYKVLNGDGTLTKMVTETEAGTGALKLSTDTPWGNYIVEAEDSATLQSKATLANMLGVVVETSDGKKYGMEHLENLWFKTHEFSFAVQDFTEPHGNSVDYKRHEGLNGATITKVTWLLKDAPDVVFETNLYCPEYNSTNSVAVSDTTLGSAAKITLAQASDANYTLAGVTKGNTDLDASAYTYNADTKELTINDATDNAVGSYTVNFSDASGKYVDLSADFTVSSNYSEGSVSFSNNKLVLPEKLSVANYLNNVSSIKINGVEKSGRGGIKAADLFDENGNINFNAAIKGRDGSSTPVFADKSASYTIELTSTGYPSVSGTVQLNTSALEASIKKAEALDSSKYTVETWKVLQTALAEAKEVTSPDTQAIVDAANVKLTKAIAGLKEKATTPSNPTTENKNNTKPSTTEKKNNTKPALKKSNVKLSKPVLKIGKKTTNKVKVTWRKIKKATGYEIQYTTKSFSNKKVTKTLKVSKGKITSAQLKKLKKKTKYKVRIRAVYSKTGYQTVTSKWSSTKTVKTK